MERAFKTTSYFSWGRNLDYMQHLLISSDMLNQKSTFKGAGLSWSFSDNYDLLNTNISV